MAKRLFFLALVAAGVIAAIVYSKFRPVPDRVSGFIEADEIRLGSRVGGRVHAVEVAEGERVTAGQTLIQLEPFDLLAEQQQAAATLAAREADYQRLKAGLRTEEVAQAEARYQRLHIHCWERYYAESKENARHPLHLVSFECDLAPLTLAAKHPGSFPHLHHGAPVQLLKHGTWEHASSLLHWELCKGDFRETLASASVPNLIFYDPFSFKTDSALWTAEIFARIFQHCTPQSAELYTYSASTAVRVALFTAGFFVAEGVGTGPKSATTIAFTRATGTEEHSLSPRLLGQQWLARWRRSHAKFPSTLTTEEQVQCEHLIETHPQFLREA